MSDAPIAAPSTPAPSAPAPKAPSAPTPSAAPSPADRAATFAPKAKGIPDVPEPQTAKSQAPPATAPNSKFADEPKADAPQGETAAEKKARLLKLKVYGEERDFDLDNTPDEEVAKYLQKGMAADKAFQEKAEIERQARALVQALAQDPFEAYQQLTGKSLEEIARERFIKKYEEESLPQPEREKLELQRKLEEYQRREQEAQAAAERAEAERFERTVQEQTERELISTMEEHDLPKSPTTLYMLAEVAKMNLEQGLELTPAQMAAEVKGRMQEMTTTMLSSLKGEQLVKVLGESVVKEILRHEVQRVRGKANAPDTFAPQAPSDEPRPSDKEDIEDRRLQSYAKRAKSVFR